MADLKEITQSPGFNVAAIAASKNTIFVFAATFAYFAFFSGVSPGILGGVIFLAVGIFAVSLLIAAPLFMLKLKFPQLGIIVEIVDIAVTVFLTRAAYLWLFSQPAVPVVSEPLSFKCDEPLPEFTLSRESNPSDAQLRGLCKCVSETLGEKDLEISQAIVEGRESDVTPKELQAFIPMFGAAIERCGGGDL